MKKNYLNFKGIYFKFALFGIFCFLAAFAPKENENPKKKKTTAFATKAIDPASYVALTVSGYNADVIANGLGALNTTTTNDVDGVNFCYLAVGTQVTGTATPTAYGLPTSGLLDVSTSDLFFQMASYSNNNSLRINQVGAAGQATITFAEANSYEKIHLAVTSGSGTSDVTFTVNFSDATTQVIANAAIPDWFSATTLPVVISGIGRGNLTNNVLENPANNPRIYQLDLNIDAANQGKIVTGITVLKNSGGVFNLFAATGKLVGTCAGPTNISSTAINSLDASVTWNSANGTDTFEVAIVNSGNPIPATGTASATNSFNFTTLTPQTNYDVYVRTVCTPSGFSFWTGPFSFKTLCGEVTQYFENFDTYAAGATTPMPDCWNKAGGGSTYINTGAVAPMSPANRLYMFASSTATPPTESYAILPAVSNLQANTHRLKFKGYTTAADRYVEIGYLSDPSDISTYMILQEITLPSTVIANTQEFTFVPTGIPAGVKNLVIKNPGFPSATSTIYIDDVRWEAIPSCPEPTSLTVGAIAATTAELIWTEGGTATTWNIEYGSTGFVLGSGTQVTGVTTNPYTLTSLSPSTSYSYYVQASCGGTSGNSVWVGPFNFTTPCVAYTIPYFEGFESGYTHNVAVTGCLSQSSLTGTGVWIANDILTTYNRAPKTGSWNAFLQYGNEDWLFIPIELVAGTSYTVELYARQDGATATNSNMQISYGNNPTSAAMTNAIVPSTGIINGNYQLISGAFTPAATSTYYVGIKGFMNSSPWYISLDDISINVTPTCVAPINLTATNITSASADLGWTENGTATVWDIEWGTAGFTPSGVANITATSTNPQNLAGLTPNTAYGFYVRAKCGGTNGDSTWTGPFTFTTSCVAYTIPYFEGFESGYSQDVPVAGCLSQSSTTGAGFWTANDNLTTYNRAPRTGSWNAFLQYGNEDWLFIPIELVAGTSYTVDLYARQDGATASNSNMVISYGTAATAAGMTNSIVPSTGIINGSYQQIIGAFTPATTGTFYVGIKGYMDGIPWYISLDDISINVTPACPAPNSLNLSNLTSTSADLSWIGTTGNYEYVLDNDANDPTGAGTATTLSTYAATTLTPLTTYYFHVRSNCGSTWSTISFTTLPTPPVNDDCINAAPLSVNPDYTNTLVTPGTINAATASTVDATACFGTEDDDVWFSFVATATTHRVSLLNILNGTTDLYHSLWTGVDCSSLTLVAGSCSDPNVSNPIGLVIGQTYYVRVYSWTSTTGQTSTFDISIGTNPTLSTTNFDNSSFVAYPNPVKDVLNLSYSSEIASVKIINLLGQEVLSRKVGTNSTQIDMTNLTAGAYIVNVTIGDVVKSIKVIKQ